MVDKKSNGHKSDKNSTKQVRIDSELHRLLKIKAAEQGETLRGLVEGCLVDLLSVDQKGVYGEIKTKKN